MFTNTNTNTSHLFLIKNPKNIKNISQNCDKSGVKKFFQIKSHSKVKHKQKLSLTQKNMIDLDISVH